jgi:hypothetical protein
MRFPNLHYEGIKPFEIHVYYGSSFNPNEKWVVKGFEGLYGFFPSRCVAVNRAKEIAKSFIFPQTIYCHPFGRSASCKMIIKGERH